MLSPKRSVLIVDDLPEVRIPLVIILRKLGFIAHDAAGGFSALLDMRVQRPDILISGLHMKGMSGFELLSVVRRRFPETLVIAMSDTHLAPDLLRNIPADAFRVKSAGPCSLVNLVRHFAGGGLPDTERVVAPAWIAEEAQTLNDQRSIVVLCPECLRITASSVQRKPSPFHEAACQYCANLIPYALIPKSDAPMPQHLLRAYEFTNDPPFGSSM